VATYVDYQKRKTATVTDVSLLLRAVLENKKLIIFFKVIFALRRIGRPIYGFDPETYDGKKKSKLLGR
jgi:hypothetical protein